MKATELRIGNLVNNPYDEPTNVDFNVLHYIGVCVMNKQIIENYQPIPLTEEWLVKFGFKETTDNKLILYYELSSGAYLEKVGEVLMLFDRGGYMLSHDNLKHVHQLQNLYHALTGEELTLQQ